MGPLPTLDLAHLQLDHIPINNGATYFTYSSGSLTSAFSAISADVTSVTLASAPEPGSLTLFLLGAVGLVSRRLRPRRG